MTRTFLIRSFSALAVAGLLGAGLVAAQKPDQADVLLQAALNKEIVEGDLRGAIEQYKALAQNRDRTVAARALLRMAASYEKLGLDDAQQAYERVVREFADETASAATARTRLAALRSSAVEQVGQTSRLIWSDRRLSTSEPGPISDDGRYMTFSDLSLTLVDLKVGTTKTLPPASLGDDTGGKEVWVEGSAVSPDGRQVAYVLAVQEPGPRTHEIRVFQISGRDAWKSRRVLSPGLDNLYLNGWTPDGKEVMVTRFEGRRADGSRTEQGLLVSVADGTVRVLDGRLSPDGQFVADSRNDGGTQNIFVKNIDGKETRIDVGPGQNRNPIWSPDGSHLLFESDRTGTRSLWMVPVAGVTPSGPARLVKENIGPYESLGFTRSGAFYYAGGSATTNVYTADLDAKLNASAAPSMAADRYINSNRGGIWSPDGEHLAYVAATARGAFIRVRSIRTGEDREVPARIPIGGPPRWFPDGQSLLVASRSIGVLNGDVGYYRVNIASGDAQLLHQTAYQIVSTRPDLSSDGKTIFYLETPPQPVRFEIDTRRVTRLTPVGARVALAVSPDDSQIAYLGTGTEWAWEDSRLAGLVVAPATGGEPRAIANFFGNSTARQSNDGLGLAWSPDQRHLFFVRPEGDTGDGSKSVWRVPLAGGEAENIGISMNRIRGLRMHPDGRRIAFDSVVDPLSEVWVLENFLPKAGSRR
jgi:Tol biopolymer transport system component